MNAKLCKRLRRMARSMSYNPQTGISLPARRLMVLPAHEKRAKEEGFRHVTAVNGPQTTRGIYRWLKRHHAEA